MIFHKTARVGLVRAPSICESAARLTGFVASDPFLDSFEPELLRPGRYHADGQVEGEVYEWGSFLQSRMFHAGVRCSDCHNPHSGKLYAPGNALCVRCHEPARFDVESHSHHATGQSPLNLCHARQSATWARDAVAMWFPASQRRSHLLDALAKDRKGALEAPRELRTLALDVSVPAITRGTALERLAQYPAERTLQTLRTALESPEPLVVYGAVLGAAELPLPQRVPLLLPVLEHRLRALRVAAGRALAGVRTSELPAGALAALERAFVEVEQSFEVGASRAETLVEQSAFRLARGNLEGAQASLNRALRLQPCLAEAYLNLADLERQRGDEAAAERAIRAALGCDSKSAAAHHALGLWQVRARQSDAAIASLKRAVELAPANPRFGYVLAVALASRGDRDAAISLLETTLQHRPNDTSALQALAGYLRDAGQLERATEARQRLDTLLGR